MNFRLNLSVVVLALALAHPAAARDTVTPWAGDAVAQSRLIVESYQFIGAGNIRAGVQIKLKPGWWTYWRAPGGAGMPPQFDWSGSTNLDETPEVVWPIPRRAVAYGENLNTYKDEVVFPVEFRAADPKKPVELHVRVAFAVCNTVCMPIIAEHRLTIRPGTAGAIRTDEKNAALIASYSGRTPTPDPAECGLAIREVKAERDGDNVMLGIRVEGLSEKKRPLVLVEGPSLVLGSDARAKPTVERGVWIVRMRIGSAEDTRQWAGQRLRITLIDDGRALEQTWAVGSSGSSMSGLGLTPVARRIGDPPEPSAAMLAAFE